MDKRPVMKICIAFLLAANLIVAQQTQKVDFKTVHANLRVNPETQTVSGEVTYLFDVLKPTDTISIDAIDMQFSDVRLNDKPAGSKTSAKALKLYSGFKKGGNKLSFRYSAKPKQTMYFVSAGKDIQIWTQGQGKYTSHWFPSFDDTNEKVVFNISVIHDSGYKVISNGTLASTSSAGDEQKWDFTMRHPMSSYLLMLAIGKFNVTTLTSASGVPLELYIEPEDQLKWEPTYRYSREIFDFLEQEIGVAYPWDVYKQIPVRDFLYAGMENTSATVFARDFVVDSIGFNDRDYVNVNAHELAHQWFGDMVTATSGEHHWLQEGFATYYALLAEKEVFGEDYFYRKMYDMAENLQRAAASDTIPLMNAKASALTFYQKGAWALHILREGVGSENFRMAVKNYLKKYKFGSVSTDDFLAEINKVSDYDTKSFKNVWLLKPGFEIHQAMEMLKQNRTMRDYFFITELSNESFAVKRTIYENMMQAASHESIKEELIFQTQQVPFSDKSKLIRLAMNTGNLKVRQMVAKTLHDFPADFIPEYETLLDDPSYITQEIALNVLWSNFPDVRASILDKTAGRMGMNDKNIRILWLTLALATSDYQQGKKVAFYDELLDYASPKYESQVRMNAIENILYIDQNDSNILAHLVNATTHHKWQMTKYARDKIRLLIKNDRHRQFFTELLPTLTANEKFQLERLLKE